MSQLLPPCPGLFAGCFCPASQFLPAYICSTPWHSRSIQNKIFLVLGFPLVILSAITCDLLLLLTGFIRVILLWLLKAFLVIGIILMGIFYFPFSEGSIVKGFHKCSVIIYSLFEMEINLVASLSGSHYQKLDDEAIEKDLQSLPSPGLHREAAPELDIEIADYGLGVGDDNDDL
eukprot:TRINITY_DN1061_c0_g1_i1.p1 TRINITY_DN1061_c0_g1~~TRINITY_DN1061_c0_g1_i1.p1  ORF type:complete len:195 (+),score=40.37 TRINITY_DN1061_c0_g1_i1:62-586(+)